MQKIWVKLLYVHLHYREDRRSRIRTYKAIRCGNALYGKFRFCDNNSALSVSNIEAGQRVLASKTHCLKNTLVLRTGSCATWV